MTGSYTQHQGTSSRQPKHSSNNWITNLGDAETPDFSSVQTKAERLWCTLDNRAAGKPLPRVIKLFDGVVVEPTNHLSYFRIYVDVGQAQGSVLQVCTAS